MMSFISRGNRQQQFGKVLTKEKHLSKERLKSALQLARKEDRHVADVLFESGDIPETQLLKLLSDFYEVPAVVLREKVISPYILALVPKEIAEQHNLIVFKKIKDVIHIATTNPEQDQPVAFIAKKTGLTPKMFVTTPGDIQHALRQYQGDIKEEFARIIDESTREALAIHETAEKAAQYVPIIRMVDTLIERALKKNASDIHLEPRAERVSVRFRIDGLLHTIVELPLALLPALVTRIKIMSNLKIDEHRRPQDGRFGYQYRQQDIAIRVSMIPSLYGTKVVLRLLSMQERNFTLKRLGLNANDYSRLRQEITKPHGLILVTGPTGSGKTTTLYTLLRLLNKDDVNISTIEDPIEYGLDGITQTQINPAAGLTFANGLRSFLRQDPNIIMVGEIRDRETAEMSVNAAMTGHLVLSTLHTNDAFLALQRLIEMGVEPFLATAVTNVIIGQRLVRTICEQCKTKKGPTQKVLEQYRPNLKLEETISRLVERKLISESELQSLTLYHGRGCDRCTQTGYQGRVGIYEMLTMTPELSATINRDSSADAIRTMARQQGTLTMADDGILKVLKGQTTFDEVLRVTKE